MVKGINSVMCGKCLEHCLARSQHSVVMNHDYCYYYFYRVPVTMSHADKTVACWPWYTPSLWTGSF